MSRSFIFFPSLPIDRHFVLVVNSHFNNILTTSVYALPHSSPHCIRTVTCNNTQSGVLLLTILVLFTERNTHIVVKIHTLLYTFADYRVFMGMLLGNKCIFSINTLILLLPIAMYELLSEGFKSPQPRLQAHVIQGYSCVVTITTHEITSRPHVTQAKLPNNNNILTEKGCTPYYHIKRPPFRK